MAQFDATEYMRKHGTNKTTIKGRDGTKVTLPGLPGAFTLQGLMERAYLTSDDEPANVKLPARVVDGQEVSLSGKCWAKAAAGLVYGIVTGKNPEEAVSATSAAEQRAHAEPATNGSPM